MPRHGRVLRLVVKPVRVIGLVAISLALLLLLGACGSGAADSSETDSVTNRPTESDPEPTTLQKGADTSNVAETGSEQATASYLVPTITCPSCAARVEASASEDPGVLAVQVEGQDVTVTYDTDKTNPEKIAEAIRKGGDTVRPVSE